jgi:DNA-directed RNA polymerase specialized sigma24 family protein
MPTERQPEPGPAGGADTVDAHEKLRPLLFSIAYRMTGSVGDAEDIAQEALIRVYRAEAAGTLLESPRTFLATTTTRLAIDQLRSARVRRESYVGTWLPEPLVADSEPGTASRTGGRASRSPGGRHGTGGPVPGCSRRRRHGAVHRDARPGCGLLR